MPTVTTSADVNLNKTGLTRFVTVDAVLEVWEPAEFPALEGEFLFSDFFIEGALPALTGSIFVDAARIFNVQGTLPGLTGEVVFGFTVAGTLPALEGQIDVEVPTFFNIQGTLPALEGQIDVTVIPDFTVQGTLPGLTGEVVFGFTVAGTLPLLEGQIDITVNQVFSITGILPSLTGTFDLITEGTFYIEGELPGLTTYHNTYSIEGVLPGLIGELSFFALVETQAKTAYALNARTGALTDFTNFQFIRLGMVNGRLYGLTSAGELVRLEGHEDAGQAIATRLLTHPDDRIYNDIGELVRADYMRRCYGVYYKARTDTDTQVTVELEHDEKELIPYVPQAHMREGLVQYRVDSYRGIMAQYWAVGLRTDQGRFDLHNMSLILKTLERKIWA